jgi:hypothetical protein
LRRAFSYGVGSLRQEKAKGTVHGSRCSGQACARIVKYNGSIFILVRDAPNHGRTVEVPHQPYPLPDGLRPYLLICPADLRRPIRRVVVSLCLDPHGKSTNHFAGANAIERGPIVPFAIHNACRKRITSHEPLRLFFSQFICVQIVANLRSYSESFRL